MKKVQMVNRLTSTHHEFEVKEGVDPWNWTKLPDYELREKKWVEKWEHEQS